jgi:hypothetical protein
MSSLLARARGGPRLLKAALRHKLFDFRDVDVVAGDTEHPDDVVEMLL